MPNDAESYEQAVHGLDQFGSTLQETVTSILRDKTSVVVHSVPWRVKSMPSADAKMAKNPRDFPDYLSIHDLLGMRIIALFESDIPVIDEVLRKVLKVDPKRSGDRLEKFRPNEFGYRSMHYVGTLSRARAKLPENALFSDRVVEIQVRSLLQHAWAEVEHDLGYKPQRPLTGEVRRKFSRLAALTELIDESFSDLRRSLENDESAALEKSADSLHSSPLTAASLAALIRKESELATLDQRVASILNLHVKPMQRETRAGLGQLLDRCTGAGWRSTGDVLEALSTHRSTVLAAATHMSSGEVTLLEFPPGAGLRPGFSIALVADAATKGASE